MHVYSLLLMNERNCNYAHKDIVIILTAQLSGFMLFAKAEYIFFQLNS